MKRMCGHIKNYYVYIMFMFSLTTWQLVVLDTLVSGPFPFSKYSKIQIYYTLYEFFSLVFNGWVLIMYHFSCL